MPQKIQYHWQLDVYQLSVEAAMEIYELSAVIPKEEILQFDGSDSSRFTVNFGSNRGRLET